MYPQNFQDVLLDASSANSEGKAKEKASTPASLVSEAPRPMPKDAELRLGSLTASSASSSTASPPTSQETAANTGMTPEELDMMEKLDKADNMLNSGGFGDFDLLIGDVSDPRLDALREKNTATDVKGTMKDITKELLELSGKQNRCGLDTSNELFESDLARIRDLIQAIIEKNPLPATKSIVDLRDKINGNWKLLYTNSEMFRFYNGITGFINVFPGSKFNSLYFQYQSDGYLSESRFFEELDTPLGLTVATVYSNWELVKEMSFMTNSNSVVLRSFCSKVTAGPFEYEAQENWKSLRTMSMNEVLYVDDDLMVMRNAGAIRIFFVLQRSSKYENSK